MTSAKKTTEELVSERPSPQELQALPRTSIRVIADNIRSLDNVGLLFRLCELVRVEKLYITGYTGYPEHKGDNRDPQVIRRHTHRIAKTAVYALEHQPWEYVEDPVELVTSLKETGNRIVSLEQTHSSIPFMQAEFALPLTLIIGHERQGVRQELIELSDVVIEIPILGLGNSHNVATATGIILYDILQKTGQLAEFT